MSHHTVGGPRGRMGLVPAGIGSWQGRPNRLHDRLRYQRTPHGTWRLERLAPQERELPGEPYQKCRLAKAWPEPFFR